MPKGTDGNRGRLGGRGAGRDGFTLVESLAALAICAGLAVTVAATAGAIGRCEGAAERLSAAARGVGSVYAAARAGETAEEAVGGWRGDWEEAGSVAVRGNRWRVPIRRLRAKGAGWEGEVSVEVAGMPEER